MKLTTVFSIIKINIKHRLLLLFNRLDLIVPYKILIQTTNDCNSRCDSCHIWKINKNKSLKDKEVKLEHYRNLFKSYGKNLYWLSLSGGEVTLDDNIEDIIIMAKEYCENLKLIAFTTNGLRPHRTLKIAEVIRRLDIDHFITISLDGSEELHDRLRGVPGNYKKAYQTFNLLKKNKFNTHFGVTLGDKNHEFVMEEYEAHKDVIKAVTFINSDGIYNTTNHIDYKKVKKSLKKIIDKYHVTSLGDFWEKVYIKLSLKFLENDQRVNLVPCSAGLSSIHISPYGEISPCMYLDSFSNIKDERFFEKIADKNDQAVRLDPFNGNCQKCWMNCYAPHSMMMSPFKTIYQAFLK